MNQTTPPLFRRDFTLVVLGQISLGRYGSVKDVAKTAAFLASDGAGYITGQVIGVDGGMIL